MPPVDLEYDTQREVLVIRGLDQRVLRDPLLAAYVRQCGGSQNSLEQVELPTAAPSLSSRYQSLTKIFGRLGIPLSTGGDASEALHQAELDDQNFHRFSRAADAIWHRQIDTEEFRQFVRIVQERCPGRVFYRKQLLSAYHLAFAQNACNFSVPGAGKTSVVYAAYAYLNSLDPADPKFVNRLLIVGPLSSFKAWIDEFKAIFSRPAKSRRVSGATSAAERSDYLRGIEYAGRDVELTLTSYPTLAASADEFALYLVRPKQRVMMVLDEAHYIKRDDGFWSSAVLKLAPKAAARVVLTGTPAPNGYEDLANLFKFIYPSRRIIGFPNGTLRAMSNGNMPAAVSDLKSSIRPFYTRIKKADLGLPPFSETRIPVLLGEKQDRIYRSLERRIIPQLRAATSNPDLAIRVRARLIRLRQACINPELLLRPIEDDGLFEVDSTGDFSISELEIIDLVRNFSPINDLSRLSIVSNLVAQIIEQQGKVVVWSYFLGNLSLLMTALSQKAQFVELLTGATPIADGGPEDERRQETREAIIDRFHRPGESAILIANPQAVGESISLHKVCRSAIYYDRDFNAGRFIQSKDRIHRYNPSAQLPVTYYYLSAQATIDDDIDSRLRIKERRLSDLVDSDEIPLLASDTNADIDDINAIIEAYERRKTV